MLTVRQADAGARLDELIQAVLAGDEVFIAVDDEQMIHLVRVEAPPRPRLPLGRAEDPQAMAEDFDTPPTGEKPPRHP